MVFSSMTFLVIFLPSILLLYYNPFLHSRILKNTILMVASIGFYAWGEPIYVWIMVLSIIANAIFGLLIEKVKFKKMIVVLAVVAKMGNLFVFKYLGFFISNINRLCGSSFPVPTIALPIGISFYTFQALSYVIDVYRDPKHEAGNLMKVGLYVSLFPQLIAGPIVRYKTIADEINDRCESFREFSKGVERFIVGLGKKVIIANQIAVVADAAFGVDNPSMLLAWLGALAYTIQIYFDFSGYSDMAIGLGQMFGFHFEENFNYPYIADSVTDFWRRWHISLSTWFRDYVYIPLGGNRVSKTRHIFNLGVVWLLTGIWHGASWNFIWWGIIYFLVQIMEKRGIIRIGNSVIKHLYTMGIVILCWVLFRAADMQQALTYIRCMFFGSTEISMALYYFKNYYFYYFLGIVGSFPFWKHIFCNDSKRVILQKIVIFVIFVLSISYIASSSYDPFIYFNF